VSTAVQQLSGIKRSELQQHDLNICGHEVMQNRVDISPKPLLLCASLLDPLPNLPAPQRQALEIVFGPRGQQGTTASTRRGRRAISRGTDPVMRTCQRARRGRSVAFRSSAGRLRATDGDGDHYELHRLGQSSQGVGVYPDSSERLSDSSVRVRSRLASSAATGFINRINPRRSPSAT
jgi:hypothetical protein